MAEVATLIQPMSEGDLAAILLVRGTRIPPAGTYILFTILVLMTSCLR